MKEKPIISFVMPTYNRYQYLKNILPHSILQLHELNYEIIIVDGGSTDRTKPYLKKIMELHNELRLVELDKLNGATDAFIHGFNNSRGIYVCSHSDHDYIFGKSYIPLIDQLNKDPNLGAIVTKYYITGRTIPYKTYSSMLIFKQKLNLKKDQNDIHYAHLFAPQMDLLQFHKQEIRHQTDLSQLQPNCRRHLDYLFLRVKF